jgi:putative membrane protein
MKGRRVRFRWSMLVAGSVVLGAALLPPLHEVAETFFWAHMLQHVLIVSVAAPLLILGAPVSTLIGALPLPLRTKVAGVVRMRWLTALVRTTTHPSVATGLHAATLLVWHAPMLYNRSVESDTVHAVQHTTFLVTGLIFWSAMLCPRRRATALAAPLWLFATATLTGGLGALLVLSPSPLYSVYALPHATGLSPLEDQQIAGIIMWMPGTLAYLIVSTAILGKLLIQRRDTNQPSLSRN